MTPPPDLPDDASAALLRRALDEAAGLGQRLARLEFESLCRELESGQGLELRVSFGLQRSLSGAGLAVPVAAGETPARPLQVPLGRISWSPAPLDLPVVAIDVPGLPARPLAAALLSLLSEHHRKPFARLLFLTETLAPLPLLGRYGLAVLCRGAVPAVEVAMVEERRFAISELRSLQDAAVLWKSRRFHKVSPI